MPVATLDALDQFLDRLGLIAPGLIIGFEDELGHGMNLYPIKFFQARGKRWLDS
jgi:hypothetical protein